MTNFVNMKKILLVISLLFTLSFAYSQSRPYIAPPYDIFMVGGGPCVYDSLYQSFGWQWIDNCTEVIVVSNYYYFLGDLAAYTVKIWTYVLDPCDYPVSPPPPPNKLLDYGY
jgi:hypothetical protein